jgi:hypothetical protein
VRRILVAVIAIVLAARVIIVCAALRGSQPKERPEIISALAKTFRW